jgi:hypothetical protein
MNSSGAAAVNTSGADDNTFGADAIVGTWSKPIRPGDDES